MGGGGQVWLENALDPSRRQDLEGKNPRGLASAGGRGKDSGQLRGSTFWNTGSEE